VYAGRGDAFILEYTTTADDGRYFVLVDGGPLGTGKTHQPAPYYKYLFETLKDVWKEGASSGDINVDAMVCSHPHADHIEGLTLLVTGMDAAASMLQFKGPFIVPNVSDPQLTRLKAVAVGRCT